MEAIKKTVLQAVTTGTTATGGTFIIIPDLSKIYYFKISLTQEARDLGFFEAYVSGATTSFDFGGGSEDDFIPIQPPETPSDIPMVSTGVLNSEGFIKSVAGNVVNSDGGSIVQEYGVLYTNDIAYNTNSTLIYANNPDFVNKTKVFVATPLTPPKTYSSKIFPDAGMLYFRAFAKNANGVGYGEIKSGDIIDDGSLTK